MYQRHPLPRSTLPRRLLHMQDAQVIMLDQLMRNIVNGGLDAIVHGAIYFVFAVLFFKYLDGKI